MNASDDDLDLLRRLRALPAERDPRADLWPGIQARLLPARRVESPHRRRRVTAWLLAASAALVLMLAVPSALQPPPSSPLSAQADRAESRDVLVRDAAESMADEYRRALDALTPVELPAELLTASDALDASAEQLLEALREQPDAGFLLKRLRSTYERRLKLARLVSAPASPLTLDLHG